MRLGAAAIIIITLALCVSGIGSTSAQAPSEQTGEATAVLVRLRSGTSRSHSDSLLGPDAEYNETLDLWRIPVAEDSSLKLTRMRLATDPGVLQVEPIHRYQRAVYPDDPLYISEQAPRMQAINAPAGWDIETGSADIVIAVIDGGVDITHPELSDRIWVNTAEVPGNGLDDDKNKCVDDVNGCNILGAPPNGDVMDRDGHGTFVSGGAAANTNNGIGTAGVAWNATIMPVRTLDPNGFGDTEELAEAILYAAMNGADVINMSLALIPTGSNCPTDKVVQEAMRDRARRDGGGHGVRRRKQRDELRELSWSERVLDGRRRIGPRKQPRHARVLQPVGAGDRRRSTGPKRHLDMSTGSPEPHEFLQRPCTRHQQRDIVLHADGLGPRRAPPFAGPGAYARRGPRPHPRDGA